MPPWRALPTTGARVALVAPTFALCPASAGVPVEAVLERHLAPLGVPILVGLPLGHGPVQAAAPLGVRVRLDADAGTLTVIDSPFARPEAGGDR